MSDDLKQFLEKNVKHKNMNIDDLTEDMLVESYLKGTVLLNQGEVAINCYTVLSGCVRQFVTNEEGRETTIALYTEEQAIVLFKSYTLKIASDFSLVCSEDSTLLVGNHEIEEKLYLKYPELQSMTRNIMEINFGKEQEDRATFMSLSPQERYIDLMLKRPELFSRVPQHQLASYLGITPESLSRIKKRLSSTLE